MSRLRKNGAGKNGAGRLGLVTTVAFAVVSIFTGCPALGHASSICLNEQIRLQQAYASGLPDCRAYERVSPANKNLADARGGVEAVQSSPSGERVTFFSIIPFPGVSGSDEFSIYLSTRGNTEWSTQGLVPPSSVACYCSQILGWTEDLGETVVSSALPLETLTPPATVPVTDGTSEMVNNYLRNNATGEYQLLAPGPGEVFFADASANDSRILFEDESDLRPGAVNGVPNLYEWDAGQLSLVAADATAGPEVGARARAYTENTMSDDGSRIFYTDLLNGHVYLRENLGKANVERTVAVSQSSAQWRAATPEGSNAFYIEEGELYRFNRESESSQELTSGNAGVLGTLGISEGGSYAYFVAKGVLSNNGTTVGETSNEQVSLYEWHEGVVTMVAHLNESADSYDWTGSCVCGGGGNAGGAKSSRVNSTGQVLLFSSVEHLTGYDNNGQAEIYLFDAQTGELICASCNPDGEPAVDPVYLVKNVTQGGVATIESPILTNNLSNDGNRAFFETEEGLLPEDTNGQMDIYEWERAGFGSCTSGSDGCLYLISTGHSAGSSYFGDASAEGSDVFFFTSQSLVAQDTDYNADLYDARAEGGIPAQNTVPLAPCSSEELCRSAPSLPPALGVPTSTAVGVGNGSQPGITKTKKTKQKAKTPVVQKQKLARTLRACKKKAAKRRIDCESNARLRYGEKTKKIRGKTK
jgi:hypothetical protein